MLPEARISVAKLKGAPEKFVAVGFKPESSALVFLWFGLTEKELRTKLRRRKMTEESIEQHLKTARERLPV